MKNAPLQSLMAAVILWASPLLPMQENQVNAQEMTCQETVNSVMADIRKQGAKVTFRVYDNADYQSFVGARFENKKRVNGLFLGLGETGKSDAIAKTIWQSDDLIKDYLTQIFPRCGGTGIIDIGLFETEAIASFGMDDENRLGTEQCYDPEEQIPGRISEIYREWDWYCAYVL
ncbi:hypothetical protein Lepto7376_2044 [[Leptolyngbya] sp. PCC 7376]|uniref:hypothetical protein n=1 Tax=[Leptolyngbya] sp. PCC 7376 TaxID=111781 RepID=UPI00029F4B01|nr:hypothetical protein [[Leptolyngbya] sp. PCC 7376]AFY38346.1 hypothetical protein Lepto7376_2044 [[Leptolyngbya] sp. PCC 7376]